MATSCLNCNAAIHGNNCSHCGQKADTHKINIHYLWHDVQHGLMHMDKGICYTIKELFTNPGNAIRLFIEGKRVNHFKPVSLVLVLAGLYGFLSHYFHVNMLANNIHVSGSGEKYNEVKENIDRLTDWIAGHYSIMALLQIPLFSVGTYIAFYRAGYNFVEHLVVNAFTTAQRLTLHLATFSLYYLFNATPTLRIVAGIVDLAGYLLMTVTLIQLFNKFSTSQRIMRSVISMVISLLIISLLFIGVLKYVIAL